MKNLSFTLLLLLSFSAASFAVDEKQGAAILVVKAENSSTFKGILYKVWSRLRAFNPQLTTNKTRHRSSETMGIRGNETTNSLIEPYWKDDKTEDAAYIAELTRYIEAQQYAEDGDLKKAISALNAFMQEFDDSDLKPNAQFALGISQGALGDISASKKTLQMFVDDNPRHPLVADAKQLIAEL